MADKLGQMVGQIRRESYGGKTDRQLLELFVAQPRDEAAFAVLLKRHSGMVLGVCLRVVGHRHDAEEAFQATFLVLALKAHQLDRPESLSKWLYGVALNVARKTKAKGLRRHAREGSEKVRPAVAQAEDGSASETASREWRELLDRELNRLPEKYRTLLRRRYLEGKTIQEVARLRGCPVGTIKGELARALEMLRQRFLKRCLTLTGSGLAGLLAAEAATAASPELIAATLTGIALWTSGQTVAAGAFSAKVAALTEETMRSMLMSKIKIVGAMVVAAVFVLGTAGGVLVLAAGAASAVVKAPPPKPPLPAPKHEEQPEEVKVALPVPVEEKEPAKEPEKSDAKPVLGDVPDSSIATNGVYCYAVFISPDGKEATSCNRGILHYDLNKRRLVGKPYGLLDETNMIVSPNGKIVAGCLLTGAWTLFDRGTGKAMGDPITNRGYVAAFSADSSLLATNDAKDIHVLNIATRKEQITFPVGSGVNSLAFSPDAKFLAVGGPEKTIRLWRMDDGSQGLELKGHTSGVKQLAYSADGKYIFSVSLDDNTLRVWDASTGKEVKQMKMAAGMTCAAFWPGGRALTGHSDGTIVLWDLLKGEEIKRFANKGDKVTAIACSPDGCHGLAALQTDSVLSLFRLPAPPVNSIEPKSIGDRILEKKVGDKP